MPGLDEILLNIDTLIDVKIDQKIKENKLDVESYGTSFSQFEKMYMSHLEGNDLIDHTILRSFLRFQQAYNDYRFNSDTNTVLGRIKYLTPQPIQSLSEGEVPAVVQNLVIQGEGVLPIAATVTPDKVDFDFNRHIVKGQWAYNEDDDKWYYLAKTGVKELKTGSDVDLSNYVTKEELGTLQDTVNSQGTSITQNSEQIALKATKDEFNALGQTVSEHTAAITVNAEQIALKVSRSDFNTLSQTVTNHTTLITQNSQAITLLATKDELNALGQTVSSHSSAITQNAEAISLNVSKIDFYELGETVSSMSSEVSQTSTRIGLLVDNNGVKGSVIIESINGESSVKIAANKINISGETTFAEGYDPSDKISSGGAASDINGNTTTIDGGKITANTITTLGKIESFTGLYVKNDSIQDADKYVFGVLSYTENNEVYPKMYLGRRRTTTPNASTDAGFVVERDLDGKYKFHIGNNNSYMNFDGEKVTIGGAEVKQMVDGVDTSIYEIVNGIVVFKLPVASVGDITAFSNAGSGKTVFDQLSLYVDGTSIQYDDVSKKLSVVDTKYIKKNSIDAPVSQVIYGDVEIHGNVRVTGSVTPNYV